MPSNSAEYQRTYRLRRKHALEGLGETEETRAAARVEFKQGERLAGAALMAGSGMAVLPQEHVDAMVKEIADLTAEVARLKRELAARAKPIDVSQPLVYQPTILPPTRPDGRPIGSFGTSHPAPKPASKKR